MLKEMYQRGEITGCFVEGPISIDLAIEPESAKIKGYDSPVAGDADLLNCPDLPAEWLRFFLYVSFPFSKMESFVDVEPGLMIRLFTDMAFSFL